MTAEPPQAERSTPPAQRIGLLFVHGIGEQKRFEHLRGAVAEFAEQMAQAEPGAGASVVDRTADWKLPPGEPHPDHLAPITLTIRSKMLHVVFECHECWWADLGERTGVASELRFWIWGIGQWGAPIYRELDAASVSKDKKDGRTRSTLTKLPGTSITGTGREPWARFQLALAALATLFVSVTWVLAKRVFAKLLGTAPSPTLLVQYVGDVRTYEARAAPGDSDISDPGYPRRVGIRRRMVAEMVAMGADARLDRWYVLAHSQGTVLAYNGLTEIGHALPNYLTRAQWERLPEPFRRDDNCCLRPPEQTGAMMPARPDWLVQDDVVNRELLFAKLRGFLTYGSPLNKFAALWPRIVATATDRRDQAIEVFAQCRWINLRAYQDPVAGDLASYGPAQSGKLVGAIPRLENFDTPFRPNYLLAHLQYFRRRERFVPDTHPATGQRRAIARWLLRGDHPQPVLPRSYPLGTLGAAVLVFGAYLLIIGILALVAAILVTAVGGTGAAIAGEPSLVPFHSLQQFAAAVGRTLVALVSIAALVLLFAGLWRWLDESGLNRRLAIAAAAADKLDGEPINADYWQRVTQLNGAQAWAAGLTWLALLAGLAWRTIDAIGDAPWLSRAALSGFAGMFEQPCLLLLVEAVFVLALVAQTLVNWVYRPRDAQAAK